MFLIFFSTFMTNSFLQAYKIKVHIYLCCKAAFWELSGAHEKKIIPIQIKSMKMSKEERISCFKMHFVLLL